MNIVYKHFYSRNYQYYKLLNFDITHEYLDNQIHLSGDVDLMTPEEVGSGVDISENFKEWLTQLLLDENLYFNMNPIMDNLSADVSVFVAPDIETIQCKAELNTEN